MIARAPSRRLGTPAARVLAGSTLAGGLLAVVALLVLASHAAPPPRGGVASHPPQGPAASSAPPVEESGAPAAQAPVETPSPTPHPIPTPSATPLPPPASVSLLNAPLAAHRGRPVVLQARTAPGTTCSIGIGYPSAPSLDPATADASGAVAWTWRVVGAAPAGTWPVTVTCGGVSAATRLVVS
jgi:hypothetical protein